MNRNGTRAIVLAALMAAAGAAQAAPVFSDDFNANATALNAVPAGWTVSGGGTVVIVGNGFHDFIPGSGAFIDLDGSTSNAGLLSRSFALLGGTGYVASFQLAGNHRNTAAESVRVAFGSVSASYSLSQNDGWTGFSLFFTPSSSGIFSIDFQNAGGDNVGMLLDNVSVAAVPEPGSWALLAAGLGLMGLASRRRLSRPHRHRY